MNLAFHVSEDDSEKDKQNVSLLLVQVFTGRQTLLLRRFPKEYTNETCITRIPRWY